MKIHCKYDELVSPFELKEHPKNANRHSESQIERLVELFTYNGFREVIKVSKRSGFVVAGWGRVQALKQMGEKAPIEYQDFESDEHEFAHLQADNAIAKWSILDLSKINYDLPEFGPDLKVDMLGIKDFKIDVAEKLFDEPKDKEYEEELNKQKTQKMVSCPRCKTKFLL